MFFLSLGITLSLTLSASLAQAQKAGAFQRDFDAALSQYNSGQYAKAASELESLAQRAPKSAEVQELLGLALAAESKNRDASVHLRRAVQLKPGWAAARANLAVNLDGLGKSALAEAEFKRAIALDPSDYEAYKDLGQFYLAERKVAAAIPFLEKAQTLHPSYQNGYNLALAYERIGRPQDAKREIQELLKTNNTAELHNLLGKVDEALGDFIAAVNEYQQAARMDPTESNLFDWGAELLLHYTSDPAIAVFSQGVKRFPDSPRLMVGLGLSYYWSGRYDDAVKTLLKATALSPSDPRAYYFLSKAYGRSPSQAGEVIESFRRFANLNPRDGKARFYYAMSLWKGNQMASSGLVLDQVELLLKKAIALDPSLSQAHFQLGNLYSQQKRFGEAVPEYAEAIKLAPDFPDAYYRLGSAYVHLGQKNLAQKEFQLHQRLYDQHLADVDRQRTEIRKFVYSLKSNPLQP